MIKVMKFGEFFTTNENARTDIWYIHGKNLPSIFRMTIYRTPTREELAEVDSYNMNDDEIAQGLCFTVIGRGTSSKDKYKIVMDASKMLSSMYPKNKEYVKLVNIAQEYYNKAQVR